MNEDNVLKARLKDLATKAYKQNIYTYTPFLNMSELALLDDIREDISFIDYSCYGGAVMCERQMVRFGSEDMFGYEDSWPIAVIRIQPLIDKFADELNHRDILGAIMNLGIERNVIGDLYVKNNRAYVFCQEKMASYLIENVTKVKHTNVKCSLLDSVNESEELKPTLEAVECIVASARFDAIVAALTKKSRSEVIGLFQGQKVSLNGRICERNSMALKIGDVFSIRGYGKYRYDGEHGTTRKGKVYVDIKIYR